MINVKDFQHPLEQAALDNVLELTLAKDTLVEYYRKVVVPQKKTDLLGKAVKASPKQFGGLFHALEELSDMAGISIPNIFIYEDFYYGTDVDGLDNPWIEISAKTVEDFTEPEIRFMLARQVAKIISGYLQVRAITEQFCGLRERAVSISIDYKLASNKWLRMANLSADAAGYIMTNNLHSACSAIMKDVLNSSILAENVDVIEFINQSEDMDAEYCIFSRLAHNQQEIAYAPYRLKELIRFASSDRCKKSIMDLHSIA